MRDDLERARLALQDAIHTFIGAGASPTDVREEVEFVLDADGA